jgi:hypothetical protein
MVDPPQPTPDEPAAPSDATSRVDGMAPLRSVPVRVLSGVIVVATAALFIGYLIGAEFFEEDARDPLEVVRQLEPAGLTCTLVVQVDEVGEERNAVCLSTGNEVLTIGTFAERPDPEAWGAELCREGVDGVVPIRGALVEFDQALVTIVAGPLSSEGGGSVPDPEGLAASIATTLDGEWRPYQC